MFGGMPFEGFAGMHDDNRHSGNVDTTNLYTIMGVEKGATQTQIKKAYHQLSLTHHPDKGGDGHKFKEINEAYKILRDPQKRASYDTYGLEGVSEESRDSNPWGHNVFSNLFRGGHHGGSTGGPGVGPSINQDLLVTLEDLYNGKTVKVEVNCKIIIGNVTACQSCDGQGEITKTIQIVPGIFTQVERSCERCHGLGRHARRKDVCKVLEVQVEKGMLHDQKITFGNMANEYPGMKTGDVNFVIQEKEHKFFKRKGADLLVTKAISLNQALCGFSWKIEHLDGRQVVIKTRLGEIIHSVVKDPQSGRNMRYIRMVKDEGMPSRRNRFVKGNLYIMFEIELPDELLTQTIEAIGHLLPNADVPEVNDVKDEEIFMVPANFLHFGQGGAGEEKDESDKDEGEEVQCRQS